jgi:plastocyanin
MKILNNTKGRFLTGITILFTILMISNSCNKSSYNSMTGIGSTPGTGATGGPGANEVFIQGMVFSPNKLTVAAGTTITWTNKDAVAHTVTSSTNIFDSGSIPAGGTYTFTFATAGSFPYTCTFHPSMKATVTVN